MLMSGLSSGCPIYMVWVRYKYYIVRNLEGFRLISTVGVALMAVF